MNKLLPEDIVKIIWGDSDRKFAGNCISQLYKKLELIFYPNKLHDKETINNELLAHGLSLRDIEKIKNIVNTILKEESFNIRQQFSLHPLDYVEENISKYSLIYIEKPDTINLNNHIRKLAEKRISQQCYSLDYYRS